MGIIKSSKPYSEVVANTPFMLHKECFHALQPGPHLVVLGAVHGNEKAGTQAIRVVINELRTGTRVLVSGSVTFVPIANPKAYIENKRFCERNLNRAMYIKENPTAYEDFINPILCKLLDTADVLLDLHSYASEGGAFCFLGNTSAAEIAFCKNLGVQDFVYGWSEAYGQVQADPRESMGAVEYARSKGALATTVECGQHLHPQGPEMAYKAITSGMAHLGLLDAEVIAPTHQRFVKMQSVFFKTGPGGFEQPWRHYDEVKAGDSLARFDSGETIQAPQDGCIILPKSDVALGDEWFYFGIPTQCPEPLYT